MRAWIALLVCLSTLSCQKDRVGPGFDLVYQRDFVLPPGLGPFLTHHFYLRDIPTRFQSALQEHGKTEADIQSILTRQASLVGIFGDADFSAVEEASLRIFRETDPNGYVEVAYRFPTPIERSNQLDLIPSLADGKRILREERFSIDLALRLRKNTADETPVRLNLTFRAAYK
jgi:hypothetical protein